MMTTISKQIERGGAKSTCQKRALANADSDCLPF